MRKEMTMAGCSWLAALLVWTAPSPAQILASGAFASADAGIQVAGRFEVVRTGAGRMLELSQDFAVSSGPDLYFTFSPLGVDELNDANAKQGAYQVQPELKATSGAQSYALGEELDLAAYASLAIHCWQFSHLYAVAELELAPSSGIRTNAGEELDKGKSPLPIIRLSEGRIQWSIGRDLTGRYQGMGIPLPSSYR